MRRAVEDATFEIWEGKLTLSQAEQLAQEIRTVRGQIAVLEQAVASECE